ncbi:MAG: nicotinate-nucleotide adenylyltransferase [Sulfuricella sp.]
MRGKGAVASSVRPVGILGGTFDPIHFGHLRLAEELAQQLDLAEVCFIPSGRPWHREEPGATPEQRVEMVRLAIAGNPRFRLDGREASSGAPGYTVETLASLRLEVGADLPLCLLLGADAFLGLATWHRWHELFGLAHIAVAQRPGFSLQTEQMGDELRAEAESRMSSDPRDLQATPCGKVLPCPITPLDISATRIRSAIKAVQSPRYLLPDAVVDYIQTHHLYR